LLAAQVLDEPLKQTNKLSQVHTQTQIIYTIQINPLKTDYNTKIGILSN